jgi:hypothetical protein
MKVLPVSLWWAIWTGFILNNFVIVRTVLDDFDESIRAEQVSGAYDHTPYEDLETTGAKTIMIYSTRQEESHAKQSPN